MRTVVTLSLSHEFENYTDFSPSETAAQKTDEMLAQLASWGRALREVRDEQTATV